MKENATVNFLSSGLLGIFIRVISLLSRRINYDGFSTDNKSIPEPIIGKLIRIRKEYGWAVEHSSSQMNTDISSAQQ